ncbi:cytochrome P450 [Litoribrevibacter albus]|uniref:Cytochrome P450 n=1 Tax=Litoribrevibacter albus TaxID=1473156 RepID=A0AA37SAD1_9GAMM|nr:cytochrome P450 [Litoribrevibacter albus]GLQ31569.1 cytochrome P450 [Litoribrevibacter albus]
MTVHISGPKGHFLLGSIKPFTQDLLNFMTSARQAHGDFIHFKLGPVDTYLICRPELIRRVLVSDQDKFIKNRNFWKHFTSLFGLGLLTNEHQSWRVHRKLSAPAFQPKRIANYADFMVSYTQEMMSHWQEGAEIDLHDELMEVTARIVAKALFDADLGEHNEQLLTAMHTLEGLIPTRMARPFSWQDSIPTKSNRQYWKALKKLNQVVDGFIQHHKDQERQGQESNSLLSVLMQARYEDGSRLPDKQLRDEVITLFLAGHDTTAITLSWALYLLSLHPEKRAKLEEEVDSVLAGRDPGWDDLKLLPYTRSIIKETLRLYPAAHLIGRETTEDIEMDGVILKKGASVLISPWLMGREETYFDDPLSFKPERWTETFEKDLPKGVYVPFSAGPRVCIGEGFAMMESIILLSSIVKNFRLNYEHSETVEPFPSITLTPHGGIKVRVEKRESTIPSEVQCSGVQSFASGS